MKGPFFEDRDGERRPAPPCRSQLAKSARLLPAALIVVALDAGTDIAGLTRARRRRPAAQRLPPRSTMHPVISARVPLMVSEAGRLHVFRPEDGGEEHYAVEIGRPDRDAPVLVRLHSACFTGDLLGSLKCDCGPQLRAALETDRGTRAPASCST